MDIGYPLTKTVTLQKSLNVLDVLYMFIFIPIPEVAIMIFARIVPQLWTKNNKSRILCLTSVGVCDKIITRGGVILIDYVGHIKVETGDWQEFYFEAPDFVDKDELNKLMIEAMWESGLIDVYCEPEH